MSAILIKRKTDIESKANTQWNLFGFLVYHHRYLIVELAQHIVNYTTPDWLGSETKAKDHIGAQRAVMQS
jgi:hypothetical protein